MDLAQEILMKKQVNYMRKIIRKNGVGHLFIFCFVLSLRVSFGAFVVVVVVCFVFVVVLLF